MIPISAADVRATFINASKSERKAITLPAALDTLVWADLDYLGWRDSRLPKVGYVVAQLDNGPAGIVLRQSAGRTRTRPQCSWCEDVKLPNDVHYFNVKRTGPAGRAGNTVSTLICANFECSANVRKLPPLAYAGFDREAANRDRIEILGLRSRTFVTDVRDNT